MFSGPILDFLSSVLDVLSDVIDFFDGIGSFFRRIKSRLTGGNKLYGTYKPRSKSSYKSSYTPKSVTTSDKKVTRSAKDLCQEADSCVNTDPKRALTLYEQAANLKDEKGQRACADMY